jgi:hypothetical protein
VIALVSAYVWLFPTGCNSSDAPSLERCVSLMGNPAFSVTDWGLSSGFDILIPVAAGAAAGFVSWLVLGTVKPATPDEASRPH